MKEKISLLQLFYCTASAQLLYKTKIKKCYKSCRILAAYLFFSVLLLCFLATVTVNKDEYISDAAAKLQWLAISLRENVI